MTMKNKRFILTVPDDIQMDVADIKRELFFDESYSEMYRQLIRMGLDALKAEKVTKEGGQNAV